MVWELFEKLVCYTYGGLSYRIEINKLIKSQLLRDNMHDDMDMLTMVTSTVQPYYTTVLRIIRNGASDMVLSCISLPTLPRSLMSSCRKTIVS